MNTWKLPGKVALQSMDNITSGKISTEIFKTPVDGNGGRSFQVCDLSSFYMKLNKIGNKSAVTVPCSSIYLFQHKIYFQYTAYG